VKPIVALLLSLIGVHASAAHELVAALGPDVAVSYKGETATVEYCPDNTCEVFTLKSNEPLGLVQDFAFAYLFAYSSYAYLKGFQSSPQTEPVLSVLARYRESCSRRSSEEAAKCVVAWVAMHHDVQAHFVRFDEGKRHSTPISLAAYRRGA
jgi:hypothetical protein